jgi:hypothetical protein
MAPPPSGQGASESFRDAGTPAAAHTAHQGPLPRPRVFGTQAVTLRSASAGDCVWAPSSPTRMVRTTVTKASGASAH